MTVSVPTGVPPTPVPLPTDATAPTDRHQCGRCRGWFDVPHVDVVPDDDGATTKWWSCPPCTASLLPTTRVP